MASEIVSDASLEAETRGAAPPPPVAWHATLSEFTAAASAKDQGGGSANSNVYKDALARLAEPLLASGAASDTASVVQLFTQVSERIGREVSQRSQNHMQKKQPLRFRSLGFNDLERSAMRVSSLFEMLLQSVKNELSRSSINVDIMKAPLKGKTRALVKTTIKYGGDVTYLVDILRATLIFDSLENMYGGLEALIFNSHMFKGNFFRISEFEDRYQKPMSGGYSDIQLVLDCGSFMCELQINTQPMIRAKMQGGGHSMYRRTRFVHEHLLYAAINADWIGLKLLVDSGLIFQPDMVSDLTGFTALHFACEHRALDVIKTLLRLGSSPFKLSKTGTLPLGVAIANSAWECAEVLIAEMLSSSGELSIATLNSPQLRLAVFRALSHLLETLHFAGVKVDSTGGTEKDCGTDKEFQAASVWQVPLRVLTAITTLVSAITVTQCSTDVLAPGRSDDLYVSSLSCWHTWALEHNVLCCMCVSNLRDREETRDAVAPLIESLVSYGTNMSSSTIFDSALDLACCQDTDEATFTLLMASLGGTFVNTKHFYQIGRNSLMSLKEASRSNVTVAAQLGTLVSSPEQYRATILYWSNAKFCCCFGAQNFGSMSKSNLLNSKSWECAGHIPDAWREDFAQADYDGPIQNFFDANDLVKNVIEFVTAPDKSEQGPVVCVLHLLEAISLVSVSSHFNLLDALFASVAPNRVRLILLFPTEANFKKQGSFTNMKASWPGWPLSVAHVLNNILFSCLKAQDAFENNTKEFYDCGGDAVEQNGLDSSSSSRPFWNEGKSSAPRIGFIDAEEWEAAGQDIGSGQSKRRSLLLSKVLAQLQGNLISMHGVTVRDFEYLFGSKEDKSKFSNILEVSSVVVRYLGMGFDKIQLVEFGEVCRDYAKFIDLVALEQVDASVANGKKPAHGGMNKYLYKKKISSAHADIQQAMQLQSEHIMGGFKGLHVEYIGENARKAVLSAGITPHELDSLPRLSVHASSEDTQSWQQHKCVLVIDVASFEKDHLDAVTCSFTLETPVAQCIKGLKWNLVLLLPPLKDPPLVQADIAADDFPSFDKQAIIWLKVVKIITWYVDMTQTRSVFFVEYPGQQNGQNENTDKCAHSPSRATAKTLLRSLTSSPMVLESVDKMIAYPRLRYFVPFVKTTTCVPCDIALEALTNASKSKAESTSGSRWRNFAVDKWRDDVAGFINGCGLKLPRRVWDGCVLKDISADAKGDSSDEEEQKSVFFNGKSLSVSSLLNRPIFAAGSVHIVSGAARHFLGPTKLFSAKCHAYPSQLSVGSAKMLNISIVNQQEISGENNEEIDKSQYYISLAQFVPGIFSVFKCGEMHVKYLQERAKTDWQHVKKLLSSIYDDIGDEDDLASILCEIMEDLEAIGCDYREVSS